MCGISGIFIFNNQKEKLSLIRKMSDILVHRGPDGEGFWTNDKSVSLGHRRLSIIDLSDNGGQPMFTVDGRYTIVYNGEIYNYLELRNKLAQKGYTFKSTSDTEVILNLYAEKGVEMLSEIDGMFAFSIWDAASESLFCARDRYGEKPFYYSLSSEQFLFASEMKAIFTAGIKPIVSQRMLVNYIINDLVIDPENESHTFYEGVHKLEKAHYIIVDKTGKITKQRYYSVQLNQSSISFESAQQELSALLKDSIDKRMRSDVPVGTSLSGGIDSSIIASLMKDKICHDQEDNLMTYSARFHESDYSESEYIDCVLNHLNIGNKSVFPSDSLISEEIEKVFYHQEEPFQSANILNQWSVMKLVSQNKTKVVLDGQGADELLGGYLWYYKIYLKELYLANQQLYKNEFNSSKENFNYQGISFSDWLRMKSNYIDKKVPVIQRFVKSRHPILKDFDTNFIKDGLRELPIVKSYPNDLNHALFNDFDAYVLETLLRFSDRNSMAFSVEVRLPYLAKDFVDFVFSLPSEYKINQGWRKYILRKAFEQQLPSKITWRKDKRGYEAPEKSWLNTKNNIAYSSNCLLALQDKNIIKKNAKLTDQNVWKIIMTYNLILFSERF